MYLCRSSGDDKIGIVPQNDCDDSEMKVRYSTVLSTHNNVTMHYEQHT